MSRSVPLRFSVVSCAILPRLGASDAAPPSSMRLPARTAAPRLAPRKPHHVQQRSAQPPQPATHTIHAQPAFASTREKHKPSRCTQRTVEVQRRQLRHPSETRCQRCSPNISDVIVCTHRRPSQAPPPATAPPATASGHSTHHHRRIAGVRKHPRTAPAAADGTQRTVEVQRRQLRHPSETRSQRRCPSCFDPIVCTPPAPLGSPLAAPTTCNSLAPNRPSPQHTPSMHSRRSQAPAKQPQLPPMSRSVPPRFSVVSCAILPRLGASDAAPSSPNLLSAGIRCPSARPSQAPPPATAPRPTASAHSTHHHQRIAGVRKHPRPAQAQPMHAAYC
jgi:hypothetical protein